MEKYSSETLQNSYNEIKKFGFQLKDEYIDECLNPNDDSSNDKIDHTKIEKTFVSIKKELLEMDIRQILKPYFPFEINSSMDGIELKGPVVLQIIRIENITQPLRRRDENTQPRLLAIQVSDGTTKVTALEIEQLSDINASTPPGGKILFMGGIIRFGKLLFTPSNVKYLGGVVNHLLEAYNANKIAQKLRIIGINQKNRGIEGPPRFEIKLINMKSMDVVNKSVPEKKDKINKNSKQDKSKTNNNDKQTNVKDLQIEQLLPSPPPKGKKNSNEEFKRVSSASAANSETGKENNHGGGKGCNDHGGDRGRNNHRGGRVQNDHQERGQNDYRGITGSDHGGRGRNDHRGRGRGRGRGQGRGRSDYGNDYCSSFTATTVVSFLENDFPALSVSKPTTSWRCIQCTFQNSEYLSVCEMCNSNK